MTLLPGSRWRPPRVALIAAALAIALLAFVYCRSSNRGRVSPGGGVVMSVDGHDLDQRPLYSKSNSEAVSLFLTRMASNRPVSGAEGSPTRGAFVKDTYEDGKRERAMLAHSFFSKMECRFSKLMPESSDDIKTKKFLECCSELSAFFDLLGTAAFKAVKATLVRYIKAINQSYLTSPEASYTIQELVLREEVSGVTTDTKTCCDVTPTEAVLWLFRGLEFIAEFLTELRVQSDLSLAGSAAYERCLKPYHGLLLRTAFSFALKMAPYRDTFLMALAFTPAASNDDVDRRHQLTPELEQALFEEMHDDVTALNRCYVIIKAFYKSHNLDWDAVA